MTTQAIEHILGRTVDFETEVILANEGHGVYIKEWNAPETQPTQADIDAAVLVTDAELQAKETERQAKKAGDTYTLNGTDYVIPFTKFDGDALVQVETAFRYGQTLTNIEFTNGTVMPITSAELAAFGAWFAAKRNAFFQ
jgi:L-aminopeptidase/D-esterase-like protein